MLQSLRLITLLSLLLGAEITSYTGVLMVRKFRYVNHTADVEFKAYGISIDQALENSFIALFDTLAYLNKLSKSAGRQRTVKIMLSADSMEDMVWKSLQRALSIGDANGLLFYGAKVKISESGKRPSVSVELLGKPARPEYAKFDVKGISKYNLSVNRRGKIYTIDVVVDV
jgi:SHS2 domain-containing protein